MPAEQAPDSSIRDIAELVDVSPASVGRVIKDYREGRYDQDGFRYERSLLVV